MRRRALLAALGTVLAGCSGPEGSARQSPAKTSTWPLPTGTRTRAPTRTPTDEPAEATIDETPTETPRRTYTPPETDREVPVAPDTPDRAGVIDIETVSRTYALGTEGYDENAGKFPVEYAIRWTATDERPVVVAAALHNHTESGKSFDLEPGSPFGNRVSDRPHRLGDPQTQTGDPSTALVYAPTPNHDLVEDPPPVYFARDGTWRVGVEKLPTLVDSVHLAPDQKLFVEFAVVGRRAGVGAGRPEGRYDFRGGSVSVWHTGRPGPDGNSRFAGRPAPEGVSPGTTAWYHRATPQTPTFLRPSTERARLPATVEFVYVNRSRDPEAHCGHLDLYKFRDGRWFDVSTWAHLGACGFSAGPGGAAEWTLDAYHDEAPKDDDGVEAKVEGHLGGGTYAAVASMGHATDDSGALVEFVAPQVELVPTEDVETTREGSTVTVTSPEYTDDLGTDATLTARRVTPNEPVDRTYVAEQVMDVRGLRNTLALFRSGVDRVILQTDLNTASGAIAGRSERFRYRGDAYAARVEVERQ